MSIGIFQTDIFAQQIASYPRQNPKNVSIGEGIDGEFGP